MSRGQGGAAPAARRRPARHPFVERLDEAALTVFLFFLFLIP